MAEIENSSEESKNFGNGRNVKLLGRAEQVGLWWSRSAPEKGSHAALEGEKFPDQSARNIRHNVTEIADF
jgi:hypothetical protein